MKTRYLIVALMIVIVLLIILAYYSPEVPEIKEEKPKFVVIEAEEPKPVAAETEAEAIEEAAAETNEVIIKVKNGFFDPDDLIIEKGTKIVWLNEDDRAHKVADRNTPRYFYSDQFLPGKNYSFTFDEAGAYNYYDVTFYKTMRGKITVKEKAMPITGKVIAVPSYKNKIVGALVLFAIIMLISVYLIFYYEKKH